MDAILYQIQILNLMQSAEPFWLGLSKEYLQPIGKGKSKLIVQKFWDQIKKSANT